MRFNPLHSVEDTEAGTTLKKLFLGPWLTFGLLLGLLLLVRFSAENSFVREIAVARVMQGAFTYSIPTLIFTEQFPNC